MRYTIIIAIFLLLSISVQAQVRIGPKVGLTLSQQSLDSDYLVWKSGFEFGAVANISLNSFLYLQSEFLITQKGYKEVYGNDELFNQLTATYWQLPVSIQYRRGLDLEYFATLGVYAARWQSGTFRSRIVEDNDIVEEQYAFTRNYNVEGFRDNRTDFGALVAVGFIYPLSINHLMLDVRYNHGFSDVNDLQNEPEGYKVQSNRNIVISLTLLFYL